MPLFDNFYFIYFFKLILFHPEISQLIRCFKLFALAPIWSELIWLQWQKFLANLFRKISGGN